MKTNITVSIETIQPAHAKMILEDQEQRIAKGLFHQRTINESTVNKYALDMQMGHWLVNNQGIAYDREGNLIDGRHRLWAIVKAGVPVETMVMRGLESVQNKTLTINPIDTIDCGRPRRIAHQLQLDGITNSFLIASTVRCTTWIAFHPTYPPSLGVISTRQILSNHEDSIRKMQHILGIEARGYTLSVMSLYAQVNPRKAYEFATSFKELVGLGEGSPVIALRKYFRVRAEKGSQRTEHSICAAALALQHYDEDSTVNSLRHTSTGVEWLQKLCKANLSEVRSILGK